MTDQDVTSQLSGTVGDYLGAGVPSQNTTAAGDQRGRAERQIAFVDSSALVALADAADAAHDAAVAAYRDLVNGGYRLFTTDFMIAETYDLLRSGPGPDVARRWLAACEIATCQVEERDLARARQHILTGPAAPAIGYADAITLAVLDRLQVTDVFAVDQSVLNALPE